MTDLTLIWNPTAGRGRARHALPIILDQFSAAHFAVDLRESAQRGGIETQVCNAANRGANAIVVIGGDGSVHEAANGLLHAERQPPLGILPAGTGNDFAKAAGIELDIRAAISALTNRLTRGATLGRIDVGECNERFFVNGAGIGIDARVADVASRIRLPIGDAVYAWGVVRCLIEGIATPPLRLSADGEALWNGPATLINVANGPWVGSRFHIAPGADISDGRFDLIIADAVTRRRVAALIPLLLHGRHVGEDEIHRHSVMRVTVESDAPLPCHLDGEPQRPVAHIELRCRPGALTLL